MVLGIFFVRPVPPATRDDASIIEAAEVEELGQEPDERTPLTAKAGETKEINVTGWKLLREFDFWAIFLFNGLCSGTGLSKSRASLWFVTYERRWLTIPIFSQGVRRQSVTSTQSPNPLLLVTDCASFLTSSYRHKQPRYRHPLALPPLFLSARDRARPGYARLAPLDLQLRRPARVGRRERLLRASRARAIGRSAAQLVESYT